MEAGRPVLGICVGMQVLFAAGVEHGVRTEGCGVFPGTVERLDAPVLPHMGWNTVAPRRRARCCSPASRHGTRFYFVHSYALRMRDAGPLLEAGAKITVTEHGEPFAAAVEQGVRRRDPVPPGEVGRRRRGGPVQLAGDPVRLAARRRLDRLTYGQETL